MQYQKFIHEISGALSVSTVCGIHAVASMVFKLALKYEVVVKNPTTYIDMPKDTREALPKYMEKEHLQQFLDTAKKMHPEHLYTIFLVLAYTGLRRAELCALSWDDVDFANKVLYVNKTHTAITGGYLLEEPKTKRSKRAIPISDMVVEELKKHKARQKLTSFNKLVFFNRKGKPLNPSSVYTDMSKINKAAGLTPLPPHSLRHTHVSLLAAAGVPLETIAERLGHAGLKMIIQIYLHITKGAKRDAADKFDQYMSR